MKKRIMAILLALVLVFAGCGSKTVEEKKDTPTTDNKESKQEDKKTEEQKPEETKPETKENIKLDVLWFADGVETESMKKIMDLYIKENPHVSFNMIEVAYKDLDAKIKTMIAGGEPPAIARITNPGLIFDHAVDLTEALGGYEAFSTQYMKSMEPYYVRDGRVIAIPMDVTANGLIYNKTLFDKAGVKVPQSENEIWTWDEFAEKIKEVKEKGGAKYGLVWDFTPHRYSTLLYQFGGQIFSDDGTDCVINDEHGVKAVEFFKKMHEDDIIPKSVWLGGENPNNLFRSGTVAAHFCGNWMLSNYRDITDFEWGVTYAPKEERRSSVPGGKYLMAFKKSGQEEEAIKFLKFFAEKENTGEYCRNSLFISPRLDNAELEYEFGKDMFAIYSNELKNTPPAAAMDWARQDIMPKVSPDIKEQIVEVLMGNKTGQEAMDKVAETAKEVISENKK